MAHKSPSPLVTFFILGVLSALPTGEGHHSRNLGDTMATKIYLTVLAGITVLLDTTTTRVHELRHSDRGSVTTEQVIITAALVGLAVIVVGAIAVVVNNKVALIK